VPTEITVPGFTLHENTAYRGRTAVFKLSPAGKIVAPFNLSDVSFVVAPGKIVYIKYCENDLPYEVAYYASVSRINLTNICGIRSDDRHIFSITFNGISTEIHNNDCRRIFGNVIFKIFELAPDRTTESAVLCRTTPEFIGADRFTFRPFNHPNSETVPPYNNYVHNRRANQIPTIRTIMTNSRSGRQATGVFWVGSSAIREGRVKIIATSNLATAHKNL
jgi:hypothetical protein